jgi:hypothetical protein
MSDLEERAESFGYKCAWLAVRVPDPQQVIPRMGIADVRSVSRREGSESHAWAVAAGGKLQRAYCVGDGQVFHD